MTDEPALRCPRCGGQDEKDLRRVRRGTGLVLVLGGSLWVALLAVATSPSPAWALPAALGVVLLGLATLVGAGRARYCARCNVRLEPPAPP